MFASPGYSTGSIHFYPDESHFIVFASGLKPDQFLSARAAKPYRPIHPPSTVSTVPVM